MKFDRQNLLQNDSATFHPLLFWKAKYSGERIYLTSALCVRSVQYVQGGHKTMHFN